MADFGEILKAMFYGQRDPQTGVFNPSSALGPLGAPVFLAENYGGLIPSMQPLQEGVKAPKKATPAPKVTTAKTPMQIQGPTGIDPQALAQSAAMARQQAMTGVQPAGAMGGLLQGASNQALQRDMQNRSLYADLLSQIQAQGIAGQEAAMRQGQASLQQQQQMQMQADEANRQRLRSTLGASVGTVGSAAGLGSSAIGGSL